MSRYTSDVTASKISYDYQHCKRDCKSCPLAHSVASGTRVSICTLLNEYTRDIIVKIQSNGK